MEPCTPDGCEAQSAVEFYRDALQAISDRGVPFVVGGAYAFRHYAGIARDTKDFDIFVHPRDLPRALAALTARGYRTEVPFEHWLAKAWAGDAFMDLIFNSGNGVVPVDDEWFEHAPEANVLGLTLRLTPVEEMVWSKSFVMERERCDAADVAHLLLRCGRSLNWHRLLRRFGHRWRVLHAHLVLFGFVYPSERTRVPSWVVRELSSRLEAELDGNAPERLCQGTVLSRAQYLVDIERWGFEDARTEPRGSMTPEDIARWTAAIDHAQ